MAAGRKLIDTRKLIEDDAATQISFGQHVPDPSQFPSGGVCNVGWLAGTSDVDPRRSEPMTVSAARGSKAAR